MNVIQELHQFEDGLRPAQPSAAHDWDSEKWVLDAVKVAQLEQQETERLCAKVDAAADKARTALAGDPLKAMEYAQAAVDAQAYKDAGLPEKRRTAGRLRMGRQRPNGQTSGRTDPEQSRAAERQLTDPAHIAPQGQNANPRARRQGQYQSGP